MVTLRKRRVGNTFYYYLEHSIKSGNKVEKKEKYLGKVVPKNMDEVKKGFLDKIYAEKWYSKLDEIKKNFSEDIKAMPKEIQEKYTENFMIKFTYDTNRIEGGTLSLRDTAGLLLEGRLPANKSINDVKEAEAHKKVFYEMLSYKEDLHLSTILHWHNELFKETKPGIAGKIRTYSVYIGGSRTELPSAAEVTHLVPDFFKWYSQEKNKLHPVELAALVHYRFVSVHPFGDGNGRMSRLMMNFVLHKHGFPMLDMSYKNRNGYYIALERSQINNNERIFVQYLMRRYLKDYKKYVAIHTSKKVKKALKEQM